MITTAALSPAPGADFELVEVDLDDPREDEIVVEVVASGLCHTDLVMRDAMPAASFPRILGHEGAGIVRQVGSSVESVLVGDHVVLSFRACRTCETCRNLGVGYCSSAARLNQFGVRPDGSAPPSPRRPVRARLLLRPVKLLPPHRGP